MIGVFLVPFGITVSFVQVYYRYKVGWMRAQHMLSFVEVGRAHGPRVCCVFFEVQRRDDDSVVSRDGSPRRQRALSPGGVASLHDDERDVTLFGCVSVGSRRFASFFGSSRCRAPTWR